MIPLIIHHYKHTQRHNTLMKELKGQGIDKYEIVDAIMDYGTPAVGIMRSFKKCIQTAKDRGLAEVCIMEDDVHFLCKGAFKRFLELNEWVTKHTREMEPVDIFLGNIYDGTPVSLNYFTARVTGKLSGLTCMIVKKRFYDRFLEAEEPYQTDYWLSEIAQANIYCAYPFLTLQHDGLSYNTGKVTDYNKLIHTRYKLTTEIK